MATVVNTIRIPGPQAAVFDLVTSARFWPQWHPASRAVGGVTQRPYQLSEVVHERGEVADVTFQIIWKVQEHVRPTRVVLQAQDADFRITYAFDSRDGAVEFRRQLDYDEVLFRAVAPDAAALNRLVHAHSEEALRRLKELVETILREEAAGLPARPTC